MLARFGLSNLEPLEDSGDSEHARAAGRFSVKNHPVRYRGSRVGPGSGGAEPSWRVVSSRGELKAHNV
jgi:hypothetical protein